MNTTADRLRKGLKANGLTSVAVAERLGVTHQAIHVVLNGKRPGVKHMPSFAKMLHCSVEWLLNGTGEPPTWAASPDVDSTTTDADLMHQLQAMEKRLTDQIAALAALLQSRPCTAGTSVTGAQDDAPFHLVPPSKSRSQVPTTT